MNRCVGIVIGQMTFGGAERQIYELAVGLREFTAYRPVVLCYTPLLHPFGDRLMAEGIRVIYLALPVNHLSKLSWIRKQLLVNQCEIAYAFLNPANINCWLARSTTSVRLITSVRGMPELSPLFSLGVRLALRGSDKIIANSESGKRWAVNTKAVEAEKIVVIPNAVRKYQRSVAKGLKLRRQLGILPNEIVLGTLASLDYPKRPELLLDISQKLLDHKANVHIVWVGNGPLAVEIKEMLTYFPQEKKTRIHFLDPFDDVEECLSLFDIFYLISNREGLSNSLMEAMSAGLPCVCSSSPGITDSIGHKYNGLLTGNIIDGWVEALEEVIDNPDLASRLGSNAAKDMASLSPEVLVKKTAEIFDSLIIH